MKSVGVWEWKSSSQQLKKLDLKSEIEDFCQKNYQNWKKYYDDKLPDATIPISYSKLSGYITKTGDDYLTKIISKQGSL